MFLATVTGTTLAIVKYDPGFAAQWRTTRAVPAGATIQAIASDASGGVVIAFAAPQDPNFTVLRFTAAGAFASQASIHGGVVALDGNQPVVAWTDPDAVRITRFTATGGIVWSRAFAGRAEISAIAVDPLHNVVFGGLLVTEVDFGGGPLPLLQNPDHDTHGFVAKLSAGGNHVFSTANRMTQVNGIAANATRVVVSATELTGFNHARLQLYDAGGTPIPLTGFDPSFGTDFSRGGAVAISASGRIWWNLHFRYLPGFEEQHYLVALHE
jgi:hypothetical protein